MNTAAAAQQAGVTVATIRTWCRRGVIAAAKTAGRWVIATASLLRRIEIGARMVKPEPTIDLENASYTYTEEFGQVQTVTPKVRDRVRNGLRLISIGGLAALVPDALAKVDEALRPHIAWELGATRIVLCETPRPFVRLPGTISCRDGRIMISGLPNCIPTDVLVELGERLHDQLI